MNMDEIPCLNPQPPMTGPARLSNMYGTPQVGAGRNIFGAVSFTLNIDGARAAIADGRSRLEAGLWAPVQH